MGYRSTFMRLWTEIGGTEIEGVQITMAYEMNRIPRATFIAPVGRDVHTLKASAVHNLIANLQSHTLAVVRAEFAGVAGARGIDITGGYTLFEGHITGIGYKRGPQGYQIAIEITHWLNDLNFSSTLSAQSHPSNPTHFSFNPNLKMKGDAGGAGHFGGKTVAQDNIDDATVAEDLWGKSILPFFLDLAASDRLNVEKLGRNDSEQKDTTRALERFKGDVLKMKLSVDSTIAALAIAEDISVSMFRPGNRNVYNHLAHTTFWNKLVGELAPNYMFSVIPYPHKAKVVPFIPGFREHWEGTHAEAGYTIASRDLSYIDVSTSLPHELRGYLLITGHGSRAGAIGKPEEVLDTTQNVVVGGCYAPRDDGLVMISQAPRWLSQFVSPSLYSRDAAGGGGAVRGNAVNHPGVGPAPAVDAPNKIKQDELTMLDNMAQALYCYEMIKGRVGQISGACRFDICPGSTIKFEGASDKFVLGEQPIGADHWATVLRVTYHFDAQTVQAGTSYQLGHIRSTAENASDDTSVAGHPVYEDTFKGDEFLIPFK